MARNFVKSPLEKKPPHISLSRRVEEKTYNQLLFKDNDPKSDNTTDRILRCCKINDLMTSSEFSRNCAHVFLRKCGSPSPTDGLTGFYGPPNLMHDVKTNANYAA